MGRVHFIGESPPGFLLVFQSRGVKLDFTCLRKCCAKPKGNMEKFDAILLLQPKKSKTWELQSNLLARCLSMGGDTILKVEYLAGIFGAVWRCRNTQFFKSLHVRQFPDCLLEID